VCCQANDCNSQLIPLPSGEYECKKCLTNCSKGIDKYNLKLQVEDANGNAKLKLVDKDCMQLIGKTASDLRAKHRRITPQLPKEIQSLVGLGMLFMVEVKREQLENRYAPFSVTKIINDQTLVSLYCPEVIKKLVSWAGRSRHELVRRGSYRLYKDWNPDGEESSIRSVLIL